MGFAGGGEDRGIFLKKVLKEDGLFGGFWLIWCNFVGEAFSEVL